MPNHPDISIPLTPGFGYHIYNQGNEKRNIFFKHRNYGYFIDKYLEYMKGFVDVYSFCLLPNHFHIVMKLRSVPEILECASNVGFDKVNSLFFRRYVAPWFFKPVSSGLGLTVLPIYKNTIINKSFPDLKDIKISKIVELLNLQHGQPSSFTKPASHPLHLEELQPYQQLASYIVSERFRRFLLAYSKAINIQEKRTGSLLRKAFRRKWIKTKEDAKRVITYVHHNPIHHGFTNEYHLYEYSSYNEIIKDDSSLIDTTHIFDLFGGMHAIKDYSSNYKIHQWKNENFYIEDETFHSV